MKKIIALFICVMILITAVSCAEPHAGPAGTVTDSTPEDIPADSEQAGTPADSTPTDTSTVNTPADTADDSAPAADTPVPAEDFDLYLADFIEKTNTKSYVISPLSFRYALGMLAAGAGSETLDQMVKGLGDLGAFEELIKQFNSFEEGFNAKLKADKEYYDRSAKKEYLTEPKGALRASDSVWKRSDLGEFKNDYKLRLEMYNAEHFDFTKDDIIDRVNSWANEKTEGLIPSILPENYDVNDLAIVLMNALYYKNSWAVGFSKEGSLPFTSSDGKTADRDFIISDTENMRYYKDGETELVSVPMQNGVDFIIVLGDAADLRTKLGKSEYRKVTVEIPEFTTETSLDKGELVSFLRSLGITDVFDPGKADLSGMIENKNDLYVSDIIQKAKIKLDETGVEAAAVTAIMVNDKSFDPTEPVRFRADREFRFYICTGKTDWAKTDGIIMFEGRVSE